MLLSLLAPLALAGEVQISVAGLAPGEHTVGVLDERGVISASVTVELTAAERLRFRYDGVALELLSSSWRPERAGEVDVNSMSEGELGELLVALDAIPFADDRYELIWWLSPTLQLSVDQLAELMQAFPLSDDRVELAALLAPRVVDPENAGHLAGHLPFPADREAVLELFDAGDDE
jgi:hypothetical protein